MGRLLADTSDRMSDHTNCGVLKVKQPVLRQAGL